MNWRWVASGVGLLVSGIFAAIMASAHSYTYSDRRLCSVLLVSFGYLFLSNNTRKEAAETPWWW